MLIEIEFNYQLNIIDVNGAKKKNPNEGTLGEYVNGFENRITNRQTTKINASASENSRPQSLVKARIKQYEKLFNEEEQSPLLVNTDQKKICRCKLLYHPLKI